MGRHWIILAFSAMLSSGWTRPAVADQAAPQTLEAHDQKRFADQRQQFLEALRLGQFPGWARDTVVGLLFAREHPEEVPAKAGAPAVPALEDELCALDAEVDLMASALLALREPDSVLMLYRIWYADDSRYFDKNNGPLDTKTLKDPTRNWRTPASPLIFAQAYRLRAWQRFFPRPDQAFKIPDESRVELFHGANVDLARAANVLEAVVGSFTDAQQPKPAFRGESLARWSSTFEGDGQLRPGGVPKPRTLEDLIGPKNGVPPVDRHRNAADRYREPLPAFRAVEFAVSYHEWLCRIYRELGDLVYRETGHPGNARDSSSDSQSTALGWYSLARDHCYAGRLINYDHAGLRAEAGALADRLEWIVEGRAYGGQQLWRLSSLSQYNYVTPAIHRLDGSFAELSRLQEKDAERTAGQFTATNDLQQRMAGRKQLDKFFRAQAQRELTAGILDLKTKLVSLRADMAREDVERAESSLQTYLLESSLGLSQQQYVGELERLQSQWLHQMLETAQQLQTIGGFQDTEVSVPAIEPAERPTGVNGQLPNAISLMPEVEKPDRTATDTLTQFFEAVPMSATQRELLKTWQQTLTPRTHPELPRTTTAILYAEWRAADLERERRNLLWSLHKTKVLLREHELRRDRLVSDEQETKNKLGDLWDRFRKQESQALSDEQVRQLHQVVKPKLEEELQYVERHLHRALDELKTYQQKLAHVRQTVEKIKQARAKVDEAYGEFVSLVQTAKSIPTTIAAGLTSGTMFDSGEAIARGAEAVMKKLDGVLSGQISAVQLEESIGSAEKTVSEFLDKVGSIENQYLQKKAELQKVLGREAVLADYQPGGAIYSQFAEEERNLNETNRELAEEVRKTESQIQEEQKFVDSGDDQELELLHTQAVANGRAALGRLISAYDQRDQLLAKLVSLKSQWEGVAREEAAAQGLVAQTNREKNERKDSLARANGALDVSKQERAALMPELQAAILAFDAERQELQKPAHRMMTAELLEAMAPALALASLNPLPDEQQRLLDAANADLMTAARWLYFMTGQERMAAIGSPCQSLYELKLARNELQRAWREFHEMMGGAKPQILVVRFGADDLKTFNGRLVFRTRASKSPNTPPPTDNRLWLFRDGQRDRTQPVWEYSKPIRGTDSILEFYLSSAARQAANGSLLLAAWPICEWKAANGNPLENLPDAYPQLRRVGPIQVRNGTYTRHLPFYVPANEIPDPAALAAFSTREDVRGFALRMMDSAADLIESPLIDPLANRFFGHGLDQTWVFQIFTDSGDGTRQGTPAFKELNSVSIVLAYVAPARTLPRGPSVDVVDPVDDNFLTYLDHAQVAQGKEDHLLPVGITYLRKHAAEALRAYRYRPNEQNLQAAKSALEKVVQATDRERQQKSTARASIVNGLSAQTRPGNDQGAASALASIVQPISLQQQLADAQALLSVLEKSLEEDYVKPVIIAAEMLKKVRAHRDRLRELAETLRQENEHREVLADYVDFLELIVQTIRGENLSEFEQARLTSLLDGRSWDNEMENALWARAAELLAKPGSERELFKESLDSMSGWRNAGQGVPWGAVDAPRENPSPR